MDEDALVKALDSGKVASCGLDVFEDEPNVHPGLVANENVMLVPHMGTFTYEVCLLRTGEGGCEANGAGGDRHSIKWSAGRLRMFAWRWNRILLRALYQSRRVPSFRGLSNGQPANRIDFTVESPRNDAHVT